jgi:Tol biopolymer transport system component
MIVVVRQDGRFEQLHGVLPDGTGDVLVSRSATNDRSPAISPDGSRVMFVHELVDGDVSVIATLPFGGDTVTWLTEPGWDASDPAWAPSTAEFVFAGDAGDGEGLYVMAVGLEGAAPHRITDRSLASWSDPTWSPGGAWIAFSAARAGDVDEPLNFDLYRTRADGSGSPVNLTDTPDVSEVMPAWSPDGELIAFVTASNALDDTPTGGIATIRPDGSELRILTDDHAFEQHPTWAPDGSLIAFDRDDPAGQSVYTIHPDGTGLTRVALGTDPAWQPLTASTASPTPTTSPAPQDDLGLAFPICNVRSLAGDYDGNGTTDTAYVVTKTSDVGGCPQADQATNVLGVDLTGDRAIDATAGPIGCELDCRPFMAIDLNGDGRDELLVQELGGAILGLVPYIVTGSDGPGTGRAGIAEIAGSPLYLYLGGDEGFAARLSCRASADGRVLVATTAELDSIERPTAWTIRTTTFRLTDQGLEVVGSETFDRPAGATIPPELEIGSGLCGQPFPPNGAFET